MPELDYASSYISKWRVMRVNQSTWEDEYEVLGFTSASVSRDATEDLPLLESATFQVDTDPLEDFSEGWYRLELIGDDGVSVEKEELGTFICSSGTGSINRWMDDKSVTGRSVLYPCSEKVLRRGKTFPKGYDGAKFVAEMLAESTPAPVVVDGSFQLDDYVSFQPGTTYLKVIWTVLDYAGWIMTIDGHGAITVREKPYEPAFSLNKANARYLYPEIDYDKTRDSIPNRYIVYAPDGSITVAENDDEYSETSYQARGRWIDYFDSDPARVNGESYESYAKRQLESHSTILGTVAYTRDYIPGILPFTLLDGSIPSAMLSGDLRVLSQELTIDKGVKIRETAGFEISYWSADD